MRRQNSVSQDKNTHKLRVNKLTKKLIQTVGF